MKILSHTVEKSTHLCRIVSSIVKSVHAGPQGAFFSLEVPRSCVHVYEKTVIIDHSRLAPAITNHFQMPNRH